MGTLVRQDRGRGMTMIQAWRDLVADDARENGDGMYNGVLSSCSDPREVSKLPEDIEKYSSAGVCIKKPKPNTNKIKSQVTNFPCKETRKWVTEYYAEVRYGDMDVDIRSESQTECIKKARAYVEKHQRSLDIRIRKVLVKQSAKVAEISYKQASNEEEGIYEFISACSY